MRYRTYWLLATYIVSGASIACDHGSADGDGGGDADSDDVSCEDECAFDVDGRCVGNVVETCSRGEDGCRHWMPEDDCGAGNGACVAEAEAARCVACDRGVHEDGHWINGEHSLETLAGYTSIDYELMIGPTRLPSLDGLDCLTDVGRYLGIGNNDELTQIAALRALASVGEDLVLQDNDVLPNVDGLNSLTTVGGRLWITGNAALTNVDGLASLTTVGADLDVEDNAVLTNLDGLSRVISVGGRLTVANNPALPTCAADALEARLRSSGWAGEAFIWGNDDTGTCD